MVRMRALTVLAVIFLGSGLLVSAAAAVAAAGERDELPLVPAVYVFGDSTMDVGNNQYLENGVPPQLPYGIDFPGSVPTGRASNGYVMSDSIARLLGFNMSPPAYLSLTPETSHQILRGYGGVNYASGGSGLLDRTNTTTQYIIPLSQQVEYFAATKSDMAQNNPGEIDDLLAKSLFLISAGGNDMLAFLWSNRTSTPLLYEAMLSSYERHVYRLYELGARRFALIDVPAIGCLPLIRATTETGESECVMDAHLLARGFNNLLRSRIDDLARSLPGMTYSVGNSFNLVIVFTAGNPDNGFTEVASACCGGGRLGVGIGCLHPDATYCGNRSDHIYWDGVHSTEATSNKGAEAMFSLPVWKGFSSPINFQQLVTPSMTDATAQS